MQTETTLAKLDEYVEKQDLAPDGVASIRAAFEPYFSALQEAVEKARDVGDDPAAARLARLALRRIRVDAEKERKELKADSLRRGKAIDGANNLLLYALTPVEKAMEDIEKAEERRLAELAQERYRRRVEELGKYDDPALYAIRDMDDEAFERLLERAKAAHAAAVEAAEKRAAEEREAEERRAEEARLEEIRREKERKEREAEIARLRAEAEEREAKEAARRRREQAERQKAEAAARREREAIAAEAEAERKARAEAEAEAQRIREEQEAREQAERDRAAAEEAERLERERAAAAAPDREKLMALAASIRALPIPRLASSADLFARVRDRVAWLSKWLEDEAESL